MSDALGYRVSGRSAATAATAGHVIASLWNPHATKRIEVKEFGIFKTAAGTAGDAVELMRITARGTPGSTVTPGIAQDDNRDIAPPSGFLLDLAAYTVQPTLDGSVGSGRYQVTNLAAAGVLIPVAGIYIPAGSGLALVSRPTGATAWPASDVTFVVVD